jgi:hypothetical protein
MCELLHIIAQIGQPNIQAETLDRASVCPLLDNSGHWWILAQGRFVR